MSYRSGRPSFKVEDVDTVDLTGSSPPRQFSYRPAQSTPNTAPQVKAEWGSFNMQPPTTMPRIKNEQPSAFRGRPPPGRHSAASITPQQRIHPDHIARLIQTTDPQIIQKLLIDMCQNSPSLSSAIVRGLKHDSRFAQDLRRLTMQPAPSAASRAIPRSTMTQASPRGPPIIKQEPSRYNASIKREQHLAHPSIKREAYPNTANVKRESFGSFELPSSDDDTDSLQSLDFLPGSTVKHRDSSPAASDDSLYARDVPSRLHLNGSSSREYAGHTPFKTKNGFPHSAVMDDDDDDSDDAFETPARPTQSSRNPIASQGRISVTPSHSLAVAGMKRKSPSGDFSPRAPDFKPRLR